MKTATKRTGISRRRAAGSLATSGDDMRGVYGLRPRLQQGGTRGLAGRGPLGSPHGPLSDSLMPPMPSLPTGVAAGTKTVAGGRPDGAPQGGAAR